MRSTAFYGTQRRRGAARRSRNQTVSVQSTAIMRNAEAQRRGAAEPQPNGFEAIDGFVFKRRGAEVAEIAEGRGKGRPRVIDANR